MRLLQLVGALALLSPWALPLRAQDRPAPEVSFTATVLMNAFYTSTGTNNSDLPQFVARRDAGDTTSNLGATMRQTRVQTRAFLADVAGADFRAELDVDFWGGQQPSNGGRTFPLLRIRRAWAELAWPRFRVLAGQEVPPIAELNPSSLASIGLPALSGSGNLWLWIPQLRATGTLVTGATRLELEGAALAPTGYVAQGPFLTQSDPAERSKRPYLQSRLRLRFGTGRRQGELSVGGHLGWLDTPGDSLLESRAAAAQLQMPLGQVVEIRGEAFAGEGIAGLGGGAIGQNFGVGGRLVRTHGGWGQLLVKPRPDVELGVSYGIDDPKNQDLDPATQRLKNETIGGHLHWRPAPVIVGLEYRHIATTYGPGTEKRTAGHLNLALGAEF
ncbi:MAG TPA: hypothetical protein VH879_00515 [Gemmatimonadales bacterium]|jgi:hypothetical protein